MSAETPEIASDKKQNVETPTSKTPLATPPTTIPPFEKGGLGGIPRGPGMIIPKEPEWIHHLDIWTTAETEKKSGRGRSNGNGSSVYGIKKLRELILELAVRGKLVPQDPNDEPTGELLKRIQAEKAKLVVEGKIKKEKPLPPISDEEKPFELPQGWEWVRLGNVIDYVNGFAFSSKDFTTQGIGVVKIGDIQQGKIEPEFMSRVSEDVVDGLDVRLQVVNGDLVIAMSGATTGKLGFNDTEEVFYLNQRVGKIVPFIVSKRFLYFDLTTKIAENLKKSFGSAIPNLSTEQINAIVTAIPPTEEQHRIVAKVDELMTLCDQLETQHINAAEAHEKLVNHLLGTLTQSQSADDFSANWQRITAHFIRCLPPKPVSTHSNKAYCNWR